MVSESSGGGRGASGTEAYQKEFFQRLWQGGESMLAQQGGNQQLQDQLSGLFGQGQQLQQNLQNNPYQGAYQTGQLYDAGMRAGQQAIGQAGDRAMHGLGQTGVQAGQFGASR